MTRLTLNGLSPGLFKVEYSAASKVDVFGLCNQVMALGTLLPARAEPASAT